ncbi:MAG: hypothetical protein Q8O72_00440 [Bacteroidales bacterium]|nr:hypothetical protein [Bacteroidales bacterium]
MSNRTFQTIGTIIKKEQLASVEHDTKSSALILESLMPFPGYHGTTVPDRLEPDSLFVVTKVMYNDERILRAIQAVRSVYPFRFDAAPGTVNLQNNPVNVIRFKQMSYHAIAELIEYFRESGIEFVKAKKVAPYTSLIRIRKYFKMNEIYENIFHDADNSETFYIQVPIQMRWNTFEKITMQLKYNIENNNFDAAQTSLFTEHGLMDMVRIYDQDSTPAKLKFIQNNYLEAISKL